MQTLAGQNTVPDIILNDIQGFVIIRTERFAAENNISRTQKKRKPNNRVGG